MWQKGESWAMLPAGTKSRGCIRTGAWAMLGCEISPSIDRDEMASGKVMSCLPRAEQQRWLAMYNSI